MRISNTFYGRKFRSMLLVSSFTMVAEIAVMLICKVIAGNMLGESALAAVTTTTPLFTFVLFVAACIANGTTLCFATAVGEMKPDKAAEHFGQGCLLAGASGIVLFLVFALFRNTLFSLIGMPASLVELVDPFYNWLLCVILVLPFSYFISELVYADGDGKTCFSGYGLLIFFEILFSILLVPSMGIAGISAALFFATLISLAVLLTHFFRKKNSLHFRFHFSIRDIASVFRYSVACSSAYLCFSIFTFILTQFFLHFCDSNSLPVLAMIFEVIELGSIFGGIWLAAEPLISVYRGEGNLLGVQNVMRHVNGAILKESVAMTVLLILFAPLLAKLFHIHSENILPEAIWAVRMASIGCVAKAFLRVYAPFYQHHHPFFSMFVATMRDLFVPLAFCVILGEIYGSRGIWVGLAISPYVAFVICLLAFFAIYGRKRFPWLLSLEKDTWHSESCEVTPQNILQMRDRIEEYLISNRVPEDIRYKVMILVEELGMLVFDSNKGRVTFAEFSVQISQNKILCVMKDDGKLLNMTDVELAVSNLRAYFVTSLMAYQREKFYMLTTSYNRHVFRFDVEKTEFLASAP